MVIFVIKIDSINLYSIVALQNDTYNRFRKIRAINSKTTLVINLYRLDAKTNAVAINM